MAAWKPAPSKMSAILSAMSLSSSTIRTRGRRSLGSLELLARDNEPIELRPALSEKWRESTSVWSIYLSNLLASRDTKRNEQAHSGTTLSWLSVARDRDLAAPLFD